jgi:hypothetical protein
LIEITLNLLSDNFLFLKYPETLKSKSILLSIFTNVLFLTLPTAEGVAYFIDLRVPVIVGFQLQKQ